MDLDRILTGAGQVLQGAVDGSIINNWLATDDDSAIARIQDQVTSSSTQELDRLDSALLTMTAGHFNQDVRLRLAKFYAMLKIAEVQRYGQFRGFPQ